jgi:hypothetical protein
MAYEGSMRRTGEGVLRSEGAHAPGRHTYPNRSGAGGPLSTNGNGWRGDLAGWSRKAFNCIRINTLDSRVGLGAMATHVLIRQWRQRVPVAPSPLNLKGQS